MQLEQSARAHWISTDWMDRLVAAGPELVANGDLREDIDDIVQYFNIAIWFPSVGTTRSTMAVPYGARSYAMPRIAPTRSRC